MVEKGEGMRTPERERPISAEQRSREPSFGERVSLLLERKEVADDKGKKVKQEAIIEDVDLRIIAQQSLNPRNKGEKGIKRVSDRAGWWLKKKAKLLKKGKITREEFDQLETQSLALQTVLVGEWDRRGEQEWRREILKRRVQGGKEEMERGGKERMTAVVIPPHIGALFETGVYEPYIKSGGVLEKIPVLDVAERRDRERWLFENLRATMDGTVADPAGQWKTIIDSWITEFKVGSTGSILTSEKKGDFEKEIKAVMAVASSARAMEFSNGSAARYVGAITQSSPDNPNLDVQDDWEEYLLHGDESKIKIN